MGHYCRAMGQYQNANYEKVLDATTGEKGEQPYTTGYQNFVADSEERKGSQRRGSLNISAKDYTAKI